MCSCINLYFFNWSNIFVISLIIHYSPSQIPPSLPLFMHKVIFQNLLLQFFVLNLCSIFNFIIKSCLIFFNWFTFFSSSSLSFTRYSISTGYVSSGILSIDFSKVSWLGYFTFSVISLCITPSFLLSAIFYIIFFIIYTWLHPIWGYVIW